MKIKLLVSFAGVDFALDAGTVTDRFPDAEAIRMIDAGYAVPVEAVATEQAVAKPARERRG
jgi:hypothetical protein